MDIVETYAFDMPALSAFYARQDIAFSGGK
jgi:hypothetical protein